MDTNNKWIIILSCQIWCIRKNSFWSHFRHSRESGNPVNSGSSGLLLSQEWRLSRLFTRSSNFEPFKSIIILDLPPIELVKFFPKFTKLIESKCFSSPLRPWENNSNLPSEYLEAWRFNFISPKQPWSWLGSVYEIPLPFPISFPPLRLPPFFQYFLSWTDDDENSWHRVPPFSNVNSST